jgi:hypothetical protein
MTISPSIMAIYNRTRRARRIASGQCQWCGDPLGDRKGALCAPCADHQRARRNAIRPYQRRNRCRQCGGDGHNLRSCTKPPSGELRRGRPIETLDREELLTDIRLSLQRMPYGWTAPLDPSWPLTDLIAIAIVLRRQRRRRQQRGAA